MSRYICNVGNKIKSIWLDNGWIYTVDNINYGEIRSYQEADETTWFDIYGVEKLKRKIKGTMVKMIEYFDEENG